MCFSPVTGTVEGVNFKYGQIIIKDSMGYEHMITHLNTLNSELEEGDQVLPAL